MTYTLYAGIYSITCVNTGMTYIGRSVQIPVRRKSHEHKLRDGTHTNTRMQEDYNKYGKDSFKFELLEEVSREIASEELDLLEKKYIEKYDSFNNGYNMTLGGFGNSGRSYDESYRKKMSEALKGRKVSPEGRKNIGMSKKARMLIEGKYMVGMKEAAEEIGIHKSTLSKRLKDSRFPGYIRLPDLTTEEEAYRLLSKCRTTISEESRLQA